MNQISLPKLRVAIVVPAKRFFAWYIKNCGSYGVTYGALEAMIILVLWTFYSACILLFCAEMVSAYRRRDVTLLAQAFI